MAKKKARADGRYARQIYLGKDANGKRQYKTVYGSSSKELNAKYDEARALYNRGIDLTLQNDTFETWKDQYLSIKKATVSVRYYQDIESKCRHLAPLNSMAITKIKATQIQHILLDLSTREPHPLGKKTLGDVLLNAHNIFQLAINNRVMDFNPCAAVVLPRCNPPKKRLAITEDQRRWIEETEHPAQLPAMVMLYSGVRRGELIALTWSDVDLKEKTIRVNKSAEFINGMPHIKNMTKTQAGMRLINIPDRLVQYLARQQHTSLQLCPNSTGGIYSESAWRRMWESYMNVLNEKYGDFSAVVLAKKKDGNLKSRFAPGGLPTVIDTFTPHQLRHTFATMLYLSGVDVLTAKELLGHADIKTTLNIYTHLDSVYKKKTIGKLDDYLDQKKDKKSATGTD